MRARDRAKGGTYFVLQPLTQSGAYFILQRGLLVLSLFLFSSFELRLPRSPAGGVQMLSSYSFSLLRVFLAVSLLRVPVCSSDSLLRLVLVVKFSHWDSSSF